MLIFSLNLFLLKEIKIYRKKKTCRILSLNFDCYKLNPKMSEVESNSNGKHSLEDSNDVPVKNKLLKTENGKVNEDSSLLAQSGDSQNDGADESTQDDGSQLSNGNKRRNLNENSTSNYGDEDEENDDEDDDDEDDGEGPEDDDDDENDEDGGEGDEDEAGEDDDDEEAGEDDEDDDE